MSFDLPPVHHMWQQPAGTYMERQSTEIVDAPAPPLEKDQISVLSYNVLRPLQDLTIREIPYIQAFERWAENGFLEEGFVTEATFNMFGQDCLSSIVDTYTEKVYALARLSDLNSTQTQERMETLVRSYNNAIEQLEQFATQPGLKELSKKRSLYFAERFRLAQKNLTTTCLKLDQATPDDLREISQRFLSRWLLPANEWSNRREYFKQGFEAYITRAGNCPWVIALQEVTPQILEAFREDLQCDQRNIRVLSYSLVTGKYPQPFDPNSTDPEHRALTVTFLISDKLNVIGEHLFKLPETELAKGSSSPIRLLGAVALEEKETKKRFVVLTTHTDFRMTKREYEKIGERVHAIYQELASVYPNTPMILSGDMNMFNGIEGVQALYDTFQQDFPQDFRDGKLYVPREWRDVSFVDLPNGPFIPQFDPIKGRFAPNALDQLLATLGLTVQYGVRNPLVFDPKTRQLASLAPEDRAKYFELASKFYFASDHISQEIVFTID